MTSTPVRPGAASSSASKFDAWPGSRSASSSMFGGQGAKGRAGSSSSGAMPYDNTTSNSRNTAMQSEAVAATPPASGRAAGLRSRKSMLPDFGTPIKVASSSPYRTPESTSKASILLSRTPFGTPAKAQGANTSASAFGTSATGSASSHFESSQRPSGLGSSSGAPVKPVTSKRAHFVALFNSIYDGGAAHCATALQARPYLPYSNLVRLALRANWFRLGLVMFAAHHVLVCLALGSPTRPIYSVSLFFRPFAVLLSLASFGMLAAILAITPSHPLSIVKGQWSAPAKTHIRDIPFGSGALPASSPAGLAALRLRQTATWHSIVLHAVFGLCLGLTNIAGLLCFGEAASRWLPYTSVPLRLSNGQRSSALRPNERFFFLVAANAASCAVYAICRVTQAASPLQAAATPLQVPSFESQASFSTPYNRILRRLRREGRRAVVFGVLNPLLMLQTYLLIRRPLFRLVLSVIGHHSPFRPLIVPSFRRPFFSTELLVRTAVLGFASAVLLEVFCVAWEACATQPVDSIGSGVSRFAREPARALIRGMQLRRSATAEEGAAALSAVERDYLAHFAFSEMAVVASTDFERRKAIFRDVAGTSGTNAISSMPNGGTKTVSAWAQIATECLAVLREEQQWIDKRGMASVAAAQPIAAAQNATASVKGKATDDAHKIAVASGSDVIKPPPSSIWDKLASSAGGVAATSRPAAASPATSSASAGASTSATTSAQSGGGLGSLLHSIAPPVPGNAASGTPAPTAAPASTSTASKPQRPTTPATIALDLVSGLAQGIWSIITRLFKALPSDVQHVLTKSPPSRWLFSSVHAFFGQAQDKATATAVLVQSGVLPHDAALATWSVQTLSALLAASLDQDEYGTVALSASTQHCGLDDVLEAFAGLLLALGGLSADLHGNEGAAAVRSALATFDEVAGPLLTALRTGITLVIGAFEPTGVALRPTCRQLVDKALSAGKAGSSGPDMAERGK